MASMTWAALDDGFHEDPRTLEAGLTAAGLYACATTYVSRHLLDGYIPRKALVRLLDDGDAAPLSALLTVGLLQEDGDRFEVVDYLKGNQTREVVEERRRKAKERATKAANARWGNRNGRESHESEPANDLPF
jgi:hypothetical protein